MNQEERLEYLIEYLLEESDECKDLNTNMENNHKLFHALRNVRMPSPIVKSILKVQDEYLKEELNKKGIVKLSDIPTIAEKYKSMNKFADKISIWQGDITRLEIGAIVNAANSQMLGCFSPLHMCIDNVIHTASGMQLREECNQYMQIMKKIDKNYEEPTGQAIITDAYNLPSDYIIHTVGPIVMKKLTDELRNDLRNSYENSLKAVVDKGIKSIAFCSISTGVFRFPIEEAANIAVSTVIEYLNHNPNELDRVVFNVFSDLDREIYEKVLL